MQTRKRAKNTQKGNKSMAEETTLSQEELQSTYNARIGELNAKKNQLKELKANLKRRQEDAVRLEAKINRLDDVIARMQAEGVDATDTALQDAQREKSQAERELHNNNLTYSMEESQLMGITQGLQQEIKKVYDADKALKQWQIDADSKKIDSEIAEKEKEKQSAEKTQKDANYPSKWETFKYNIRRAIKVGGWIMLGLAVFAPIVAGAILGMATGVVGTAIASLSGGACTALALFGVYKYSTVKDAHKADKSKSYKWANKNKAYKEKEAKAQKAEKDVQTKTIALDQKKKEKEKNSQLKSDLDNIFKQNTAESLVLRGAVQLDVLFDDENDPDQREWKNYYKQCLIKLCIDEQLNTNIYQELYQKALQTKQNSVSFGRTIVTKPDRVDFWVQDSASYVDVPERT